MNGCSQRIFAYIAGINRKVIVQGSFVPDQDYIDYYNGFFADDNVNAIDISILKGTGTNTHLFLDSYSGTFSQDPPGEISCSDDTTIPTDKNLYQ